MKDILYLLNPWWEHKGIDIGIERPSYIQKLEKALNHKRTVLITGSRRVGKTTILHQLIHKLCQKNLQKHILYVLMDHPLLAGQTIFNLVEFFRQEFLLDRDEKIYLFLDEIQHIPNWEQEVKALGDTENVKIFVSGSASSTLLVTSSYLTGRLENVFVHPLNFKEFIDFKNITPSKTEDYKYKGLLEEYLQIGGYPEFVLGADTSYFADLLDTIIYKDIVLAYKVRNPEVLKTLLLLLARRHGHQTTYSKLARILSLSEDTVKEYLYYLKNTFLIQELPRYATSLNKAIYGPKKFYLADNGLLFYLLGNVNYGAAAEGVLYTWLRMNNRAVSFYYENQQEVDFLVETGDGKRELWESKAAHSNNEIDVKQYQSVAKKLGVKSLIIVTQEGKKNVKNDELSLFFKPLWRMLINTSFG